MDVELEMLASSSARRILVRVLCRMLLFGVKESLTGMSSSPLGKFSVAAVTGDCRWVSAPFLVLDLQYSFSLAQLASYHSVAGLGHRLSIC